MSSVPAWHHRKGEHCSHPERVWQHDNGEVDPGPWPVGLALSDVDGHWVCPGHEEQGWGSGPGA